MGQRCVNEGTWNLVDAAVITHIAKRLSSGTDLRTWLIQRHGTRSLHPERHVPQVDDRGRLTTRLHIGRRPPIPDGRPWIGDLNDSGLEPSMWTWRNTMRWDSAGRDRWMRVLDTVDGVLEGRIADPSGGRAIIWGGPTIDADAIRDREREGYVRLVIPGAANVYFARP